MEEMPSKDELRRLAFKWKNGTLTKEEELYLTQWDKQQRDELLELPDDSGGPDLVRDRMLTGLLNAVNLQEARKPKRIFTLWPRIAAAASIVIAVSAGIYFVLHQRKAQQQVAQIKHQDLAPGHNQATLTLANGQRIILTKGLNGKLAQQGNTQIFVNSGNAIAYSASGSATTAVTYNTLSTARGEQSPYPLILPDGSQVWLNASSSITFPTVFTGKERSVSVTGEAYVIVAHNAKQPFKLVAAGQTINDIGTEFNINAYADEPMVTTTLAEGSIKVVKNDQSVFIKPGQQAVTKSNTSIINVSTANLESALAWKNGKFDFINADVPTVMRQIARWYNVDIEYEGGIPNASINGAVFRNTNASNALKIVKLLGISYRIEGRKIIITNTSNPN